MKQKNSSSGMTLIELMIVVAIMGIIAALAVPKFKDLITKNRVKTIAESLYTDLQYARSLAITSNKTVYVSFTRTSATDWCYGVQSTTVCNCATEVCGIREGSSSDYNNIEMENDVSSLVGSNIGYSPLRGTASPNGYISFVNTSDSTQKLRVTVSLLGSINICNPSGSTYTQYTSC